MIVAAINSINQKGGEKMVQEVSDKELITVTIAKLSSLGVNVEDITL